MNETPFKFTLLCPTPILWPFKAHLTLLSTSLSPYTCFPNHTYSTPSSFITGIPSIYPAQQHFCLLAKPLALSHEQTKACAQANNQAKINANSKTREYLDKKIK